MVKIINTTVLLDKKKLYTSLLIESDREESAISYLINAVIE